MDASRVVRVARRVARIAGLVAVGLVAVAGAVVAAVVIGLNVKYGDTLPDVSPLHQSPGAGTPGSGTLTYAEIPPLVVRAVVVANDPEFFERPRSLLSRSVRNIVSPRDSSNRPRWAGATLTYQLAKLLLWQYDAAEGRPHRQLEMNVRELMLSERLESRLTKEEVLAAYLGRVYFGHRAYGIVEAAQTYFHKRLAELTVAEIASLAAIQKNPSRYSPASDPEAARARRDYLLGRMLAAGDITQEMHDAAVAEPVVPAQ